MASLRRFGTSFPTRCCGSSGRSSSAAARSRWTTRRSIAGLHSWQSSSGSRRGRAHGPERRSQRGARVARRAARPSWEEPFGGSSWRAWPPACRWSRRTSGGRRDHEDGVGAAFSPLHAIRWCGLSGVTASWRASSSPGGSRSRPTVASSPSRRRDQDWPVSHALYAIDPAGHARSTPEVGADASDEPDLEAGLGVTTLSCSAGYASGRIGRHLRSWSRRAGRGDLDACFARPAGRRRGRAAGSIPGRRAGACLHTDSVRPGSRPHVSGELFDR